MTFQLSFALRSSPTANVVLLGASLATFMASTAAAQLCDAREWLNASPVSSRFFPAAAGYDSARGTVVLLASAPIDATDPTDYQTWEWDGVAFTLRSTVSSETLQSPNLADDPIRGVSFAAGSFHNVGGFAEWNGQAWNARQWLSADGVEHRPDALAFDFTRSQLLAVTQGNNGRLHTWAYDGAEWNLLSTEGPPNPPSNAGAPGLVCDRDRRVMVLNTSSGNPISRDTWLWNGESWSLASSGNFASRIMTYDSVGRRVIAADSGCLLAWEGEGWSPIGCGPADIIALAFDEARDKLVAFTASERVGNTTYATDAVGVWEWDANTHAFTRVFRNPFGRSRVTPVFDEARGNTIVFGGRLNVASSVVVDDTMRFVDGEWERVDTTPAPSPRIDYAAAFDPLHGQIVLFGGMNNVVPSPATTWLWNGAAWSERDVPGPSGRFGSALAFDRARGRMVLFGGRDVNDNTFGDTWEWNGQSWILVASDGPAPRYGHAMAYDPDHGYILVAGGRTNQTRFDDVWAWNGQEWSRVGSLLLGGGSFLDEDFFSMTYDPGRGRVILGDRSDIGGPMRLRAWDGSNWVAIPDLPSANYDNPFGGKLVYDTVAEQLAMVGPSCRVYLPHQPAAPTGFFAHPLSQTVSGGPATLRVVAVATSPVEYQWRLNGVPIDDPNSFYGQGTPVLRTYASGAYDVVVSNACGCIISNPAQITVVPRQRADWNSDGVVNSEDYFAFLIDFFAGDADFNGNGSTNSQDFFNFVTCFLGGGC